MNGMGRNIIYVRINDRTLPKKIQLGSRTVVWIEQEVTKWMDQRIGAG